jgi:uncharacterized protein YoxC
LKKKLVFDLQRFAEENDPEPENDGTENTEHEVEETIDPVDVSENSDINSAMEDLQADLDEATSTISTVSEAVKAIMATLGIQASVPSTDEPTTVAEATAKITTLEETIQNLESSVQSLTQERDELFNQNVQLKAEALNSVMERIYDLRLGLGEVTAEEKESVITELANRSEDSLKDTLADLQVRAANDTFVRRVVERVTNPALADNSQPGVVSTIESGAVTTNDNAEIKDASDVFQRLLNRNRRKSF